MQQQQQQWTLTSNCLSLSLSFSLDHYLHVVNSFTGLSYDNMIKPLDPWNDLEDNYGKGAMKRFTNLKRINPDLKTLVAIGGKFSLCSHAGSAAATAKTTKALVNA